MKEFRSPSDKLQNNTKATGATSDKPIKALPFVDREQ